MAHQVDAGGTLWFYFAGHGGASPDGERLLLGDDVPTAPEALPARSVTVCEIRKVGKTGAGQLMMVIDARYNGGTRQGGSVLEGGTRFVVPSVAIQQVKGIAEWNAAGPDQLARPPRHRSRRVHVLLGGRRSRLGRRSARRQEGRRDHRRGIA